MPIRVQTPNHGIVEFPDGTDEATMAKALRSLDQPQTAPTVGESPFARIGRAAIEAAPRMLGFIKAHPVQAGAIAGSLAAAPLTGGASIPAAMAASGLGAAGGAGLGAIANAAMGGTNGPMTAPGVLKTMAAEGALGASGEGAGQVLGRGLKMLARGGYRVALAPTQQILGKYGDVVGEGLRTGTSVSKAGLKKAGETEAKRIATKRGALAAADKTTTFKASDISTDASRALSQYANRQVRAGLPNPTPEITERLSQFEATNPQGITPSALDDIKKTLDDVSGGAYRKLRAREPVTPTEKTSVEMARAMGRAEESAVPHYREMNRSIMDAEGLRRAVQRRTLGSGGNQVLDTLLMLMRGSAGIPGRVAMMPPVLSNMAIGGYKTAPAIAPTLRTALLAALSPDTPQEQ